jgi:hypothetical protein
VTTWAIRNSDGKIVFDFTCKSSQEAGRRILSTRYDPFRLQVSSSYRELFDRAVRQALDREGWEIVRVAQCRKKRVATSAAQCREEAAVTAI